MAYSGNEDIRRDAGSGGVVSTLIIHLLRTGRIDGAFVSRLRANRGSLQVESFIARTEEEVLSCRTSIYMDFVPDSIKKLVDGKEKLAFVGLPCHMKMLRDLEKKMPGFSERILLRIGLFCGHTSSPKLLLNYLNKKRIKIEDVEKLVFRKGRWRGKTYIFTKDGEARTYPAEDFTIYQNLCFFCPKKCLFCQDHTAEFSDVSCGDAWLPELKSNPIKHSVILSRKKEATKIIDGMLNEGILRGKTASPGVIIRSQKRALIFKKRNITARKKLSRLFGIESMRDLTGLRPRLNDYLGAFLILSNTKASENRVFTRAIFAIPTRLLYPYFWFLCLMLNF